MKMYNINKLIFAGSLLALVTSCNDDDTLKDVRNAKPIVSVDNVIVNATEGQELTFTLTTSEQSGVPMDFKVELYDDGSTANFRDFTCSGTETDIAEGGYSQGRIGYKLEFPAFTDSYQFTITPTMDLFTEGSEVLKLRIASSGNGAGLVDASSEIITINVSDVLNNNVGIELEWAQDYADIHGTIQHGEYSIAGGDHAFFADWDFDLYLEDENGTDVTGYAGATASSPEFVTLENTLDDGFYFLYVDLWQAGDAPISIFNHDLKLNMSKYGVWTTTVNIPLTSADTFSDYVAVIEKVGNTYTVYDYNTADEIITGKVAKFKNKARAKKAKANVQL